MQALPDRAVSAARHRRNGFCDCRTRRCAEGQEREGGSEEDRSGLAREAGCQVRQDVCGEAHPETDARGEEPDRGGGGDDGRTGEGHRRQNLASES